MKRSALALSIALIVIFAPLAKASGWRSADQYMALCVETKEHGGQEYALTSWLSTLEAANEAGKDHERANKGHRWTIRTRKAPEEAQTIERSATASASLNAPAYAASEKCSGNACGDVSVAWNGGGYDIRNNGSKRVLVKIRFMFGLSCMSAADIPLGPGEMKQYGNGGYCKPIEASYQ